MQEWTRCRCSPFLFFRHVLFCDFLWMFMMFLRISILEITWAHCEGQGAHHPLLVAFRGPDSIDLRNGTRPFERYDTATRPGQRSLPAAGQFLVPQTMCVFVGMWWYCDGMHTSACVCRCLLVRWHKGWKCEHFCCEPHLPASRSDTWMQRVEVCGNVSGLRSGMREYATNSYKVTMFVQPWPVVQFAKFAGFTWFHMVSTLEAWSSSGFCRMARPRASVFATQRKRVAHAQAWADDGGSSLPRFIGKVPFLGCHSTFEASRVAWPLSGSWWILVDLGFSNRLGSLCCLVYSWCEMLLCLHVYALLLTCMRCCTCYLYLFCTSLAFWIAQIYAV